MSSFPCIHSPKNPISPLIFCCLPLKRNHWKVLDRNPLYTSNFSRSRRYHDYRWALMLSHSTNAEFTLHLWWYSVEYFAKMLLLNIFSNPNRWRAFLPHQMRLIENLNIINWRSCCWTCLNLGYKYTEYNKNISKVVQETYLDVIKCSFILIFVEQPNTSNIEFTEYSHQWQKTVN